MHLCIFASSNASGLVLRVRKDPSQSNVECVTTAILFMTCQGRYNMPWEYTSKFAVSTSLDNKTWSMVPGEFSVAASAERNGKTPTVFPAGVGPVLSRFVKITALAWVGQVVAMRAAVLIDATSVSQRQPQCLPVVRSPNAVQVCPATDHHFVLSCATRVETAVTAPLSVCFVEEWVGGQIKIGPDCTVWITNPPATFTAEHAPQVSTMNAIANGGSVLPLRNSCAPAIAGFLWIRQ